MIDQYLASPQLGLICGVDIPGAGGVHVINHIKRTLPASAFMAVGRHSRARRFFADLPQVEEMEEAETAKLRCISGEDIRLDLALTISPALPVWCVTICDPVTRVLEGYASNARRAASLSGKTLTLGQYLSWPGETNPISRAILRQMGDVEPGEADPDPEEVLSLLQRARFVFLRDHLDAQSRGLFIEAGLPVALSEVPGPVDPQAMGVTPAQLTDIETRHGVDMELFERATHHASDARIYGGPVNPFGYDEALLLQDVAIAQAFADDPTASLERAYQELMEQIAGDMQIEALLLKLEHAPLDHVEDPDLFLRVVKRSLLARDWSVKERAKSKVNAGLFAVGKLNRPDLGRRYVDEALELLPGFHPAQKLLGRIARHE